MSNDIITGGLISDEEEVTITPAQAITGQGFSSALPSKLLEESSNADAAIEVPYTLITLDTIDTAIYDWFDTTAAPTVMDANGEPKKVTVNFASGERWVHGKDRRGIRDKNNRLILPVISVRRTGIDKQASMSALGTETPNIKISRRVSDAARTVQNAVDTRPLSTRQLGDRVVYEVATIPFPDFSIINYELVIQTSFISHMNEILQKIFHKFDLQNTFVAPIEERHLEQAGIPFELRKPLKNYYFVGYFEGDVGSNDNFEEFTDQERIVKYTARFKVPSYLHLDPEGSKPTLRIERTAFKLDFGSENTVFVEGGEDIELAFRRLK